MSTMHPQHIRRLWGGSVPVLTTNLVLSGSSLRSRVKTVSVWVLLRR